MLHHSSQLGRGGEGRGGEGRGGEGRGGEGRGGEGRGGEGRGGRGGEDFSIRKPIHTALPGVNSVATRVILQLFDLIHNAMNPYNVLLISRQTCLGVSKCLDHASRYTR